MPVVPSSTFLVANLKELEVSGSIKLGNKTITNLLDSADVSSISGSGGGSGSGLDSASTISLIDSAYVQARQTSGGSVDSAATITLVQANSVDSSEVVSLIDSSYISTRFPTGGSSTVIVPVAFAQVNTTSNGSGTNISWSNWNSSNSTLDFTFATSQPNANYSVITDAETFDDYFVGISNKTTTGFRAEFYDNTGSRSPSSFSPFTFVVYGSNPQQRIAGLVGDYLDSASTIELIDSAYIQARTTASTDSAAIINLIDSAYIQARQTTYDFLDSSEAIALIDSSYVQARQTTYDFLDSSEVISLIDSAYVQARQTTYDFLDSTEAIALIDSSYVQTRQTTYTTADFTDSAFVTGLPVSTFTNDTNYLDSTTVQGVIDASYIQSNQTTYTNANFADSAFVTTQINNLIDGAPGTLDTLNEIAAALNDDDSAYNTLVTLIGTKTDFDSADAITLIDSSYIQARQITYDFLDSSEAIALIDSAYVQARQTTYDFLDSAETIALIDSAYVQARQTTYDFLDSSEVISLIDSAYIETRRPAETIFNVVNSGSSAYTFSGDGFPSSANNPTIYLTRGKTYKFSVNASGHPFLIRLSSGGSTYTDGVINSGAETGNVIFTVPMNAPNTLVYQCQYHSGMVGNIKIFNEDSFFDSAEIISLVDSAYVQARQTTYDFLDSSEVISLIDSAYVQARQTSGGGTFDSAAAIELIDSAYVQARQTSGGGSTSVTSSDAAPSNPSAGDLWYDTVTGFMYIYYNDGSSAQWVSISGYASGGTSNAYVEATSSITAVVNKKYIVDTSSAITITLPAVPSFGDEVKIIDGTNNAGTNNITINRNSNKILGADSDFIIDVNRTAVDLVYYDSSQGWIISGNT